MIRRINLKSEFFRYVFVLMTGTVVAQALGYVFAPILTRIYTPEETGELGIYTRILAVGAALATARYENALPLTRLDVHSYRIYRFALRITIVVTALSLLLMLIPAFGNRGTEDFIFYLLIPPALFFLALNNLGTTWAIRMKLFRHITYSKVTNSLSTNIFKLVFGGLKFGYIGLLVATLIGYFLSAFWFLKELRTRGKSFQITARSSRNYALARQFIDFPKVNLPHVLTDLGRDLLLAVLISEIFSKFEFGSYDHSFRMLRIPLVFVGMALGQVFFQRCAEMVNKQEDISPLILKGLRTLVLLSIVPFTIIFFWGEELFAFVFGSKWRLAGYYSEIMAPWLMVNFWASPFSTIPLIIGRQKEFFFVGLATSAALLLSLVIPHFVFGAGMTTILWTMSISQVVMLIITIFVIIFYTKRHINTTR